MPDVKMNLKDRLRQDLEVFRIATPTEKLQFLWDYYKLPFAVTVVVVAILVSAVVTAVTAKEIYLSGIMLNSFHSGQESNSVTLAEDFLTAEHADEKYVVEINTSLVYNSDASAASEENYYAISRLAAQITAHDLDFITADMKTMLELAYSGMIEDLSAVLDEKQLAMYEPYLCYMDAGLLTEGESVEELPDCRCPELMKDPIPVMIDMRDSEYLAEGYEYQQGGIAFGVAVNAPHEARVVSLIAYLMNDLLSED